MKSVASFIRTLPVLGLLLFAGAAQAEVMLQWFETDWEEMYRKMPVAAQVGYDYIWAPPPTKAPTGLGTKWGNVGYSLYDRFDLGDIPQRGSWATRYGTRGSLRNMVDAAHRLDVKIIPDIVMNHNGNGPDIRTYPGMKPTDFHVQWYPGYCNTLDFKRAPTMTEWAPNNGYGGTMWQDLANLIDIRTEDHPFNGDPKRFTGDKGYFNFVDGTSYLRHVGQYDKYPYAYTNENSAEMLYRWIVWLGNAIDYDGLRLDAGKHTPYEFFGWKERGFLHEAQYNFSQRRGFSDPCTSWPNDTFNNYLLRTNALIFAEILSPFSEIDYWFKGGAANPMRFLDYQIKQTAGGALNGNIGSFYGYGTDFGPNNGIMYIWGHDEGPASKANLGYAYILTHIGLPMVYYTGNNINWDDYGRDANHKTWMVPGHDSQALGEEFNDIPNLVWINQQFARGSEQDEWHDGDFLAYERYDDTATTGKGLLLVALNDSGGDITHALSGLHFTDGTVLHDYTGHNGSDITVNGGSVSVTVPGNGGQGWVCYAPRIPENLNVRILQGGVDAPTMAWVVPGGTYIGPKTQQITRITSTNFTVDFTFATPSGVSVDSAMMKWGQGRHFTTNYFDGGRGIVSGQHEKMEAVNSTNWHLAVSASDLPEGLNVIKCRSFVSRPAGYPALFNTATKVVYVDTKGPQLAIWPTNNQNVVGDCVMVISNADYTAYGITVAVDGVTNTAHEITKGIWKFNLAGLSAGAHELSIKATEADWANSRAEINASTYSQVVHVSANPNPISFNATAEGGTNKLTFFVTGVNAPGSPSSVKLRWDGYELPFNSGSYSNTFNGEVIFRDNGGNVVTDRLWGAFVNGQHFFEAERVDAGVTSRVTRRICFNLYGINAIDSDGDSLPDNVEMPFIDSNGAPGADQPWPGDSNRNFIPDNGESWSRLNPYNHSTFYAAQWDDRNDFDGDGVNNFDEVYAGYVEDGNIYKYDIYSSASKPSGGGGAVASSASCSPSVAVPSQNLAITYSPNGGTLSNATQVVMHIGHSKRTAGSWQDVQDLSMTRSGSDWTATYAVPAAATSVDVTFKDGGTTWDGRDWQFTVAGANGPRFTMDGALDSPTFEIGAYNGIKLWAAVRGTKLYVATWGTGGDGNDHFIYLNDDLGEAAPSAWAKAGFVFLGTNRLFLAGSGNAGDSSYSAWSGAAGESVCTNKKVDGTFNYLEGEIDLADNFGSVPSALYLAVGTYGTDNGGTLNGQAPAAWDVDENINLTEILRVPVASIRDEDADNNFDGGAPQMWTVVNDSTNSANYGLRRFFIDEVKGDQESLTVRLQPNAGGTNLLTAVELFSNLNRRDYAKMPGDENPDSVATNSLDTYYKAWPMAHLGGGMYSATVPVNRCGAYRINARWKINGGAWRYYTDNGLRRDCAVVVSPKKALDTTLYELNPLTAEAHSDQVAGRSTFRNMYLDDASGRPNAISTNKLKQLGVNMVWLQPIHPIGTVGREIDATTGQSYDPGSPYAVRNYWQVNPVLGDPSTGSQSMTEFTNFVANYDAHGIGVMLDGTFNHSAWDCEIGEMAVAMGLKNSQGVTVNPTNLVSAVRPAWYSKKDSYGDPASYFNSTNDTDIAVAPDRIDFGKWADAAEFLFGKYDCLVQKPAIDPSNNGWSSAWHSRYLREDDYFEGFTSEATRELWRYFAAYPIYWLEKTGHPAGTPKAESYKGIDGLRCDFAQGIPSLFWEYTINKTRSVKWDFLFMAESLDGYREVEGSKRHGVGYRSSRHFDILNENILYMWRNSFFNYRVWSDQTTSNPDRTTAVIFNAFNDRKNAFELSPVLLTLISHDEIFPTDDQWSLAYAYAVNAAMDGVPMIFYGQEMGAQNDYYEYGPGNTNVNGSRSDFNISPDNNFDRYESNFGKSIPHFKRYNHMTNIWNAAGWKDGIRETYGRITRARENSPALRSQQNYFLSDAATTNWNPDIFAVAKFQQPGVSAATQDVVFAFINNNFRANYSRAATFKLDATTGGANWFGIQPTHTYNVVDLAATNPATYLWTPNKLGSEIIASGIYVGFQSNATWTGGQAQFLRLLDLTAGMTATSANNLFANDDRLPAPVIATISNRTVAVGSTLAFPVNVTKDPADVVTNSCESMLVPGTWNFTAPNNFSFTPTTNEIGVQTFLFRAVGTDGFDEELITITVTSSQGPTAYEQWAADAGLDLEAPETAPSDDFDHDGHPNEEEFWADTDPTDDTSFFQIQTIAITDNNLNLSVEKSSDAPRDYVIHAASQVAGSGWSWTVLGTNQSTTGTLPINATNPVLMYKITIPAP